MIIEMERVGDMVAQQVIKPDGTVLRYQYGKPGDASGIIHVNTLEEAKEAIAPLVAKTVDRNGDLLVQKVTKNGVLMHYQYGSAETCFTRTTTLAAARKAVRKV